MNNRLLISAASTVMMLTASASPASSGPDSWIHIFKSGHTVNTGPASGLRGISYRNLTAAADSAFDFMYVEREGQAGEYISLSSVDSVTVGTNVPSINIEIENGAEVRDKETYLNATVNIDGWGAYDDFSPTAVKIRGRGNSTWNMSKKPYRLKFDKKQSLCGMTKAKNYVLIANFIDCSLMRNAIALELASMLGLPYTNHAVPVNLTINGRYRGAYMLTEKIGINGASVDIDEETGILLELDTNFDEDYRYWSPRFGVPVMVKDPDLLEIAGDDKVRADSLFEVWKGEFNAMEATLGIGGAAPSDDLEQHLDINSLVRYLLVYNVCGNHEPCHPKSVYLYKERCGEPFSFGPVWDFDWAFTFNGAEGTGNPRTYLFGGGGMAGSAFFSAILRSPKVMEAYAEVWEEFVSDIYPRLLEYIDSYAATIRVSAIQNGELWPTGFYDGRYDLLGSNDTEANLATLRDWLERRVDFLNDPSTAHYGLFR